MTLVTGDPCRIHHPELFRPPPIRGIDPAAATPGPNGTPGRTRPEPRVSARQTYRASA